jgi:hypothetical protein
MVVLFVLQRQYRIPGWKWSIADSGRVTMESDPDRTLRRSSNLP